MLRNIVRRTNTASKLLVLTIGGLFLLANCVSVPATSTRQATTSLDRTQVFTPTRPPITSPTTQVTAQIPTAVSTATSAPTPTTSIESLGVGAYLVYWTEDGASLYLTDHDQTLNVLLAPINDRSVSLSPDKTRIAFDRDDKLYIYDLITAEIAPVKQSAVEQSVPIIKSVAPEWSPDGNALLYLASTIGEEFPSIYVAYLDNDATYRLTSWKTVEDDPAWSPDGKWIAFASDQPNADRTDGNFVGLTELYLIPTKCLADPATCSTMAHQVTDMGENGYAGHPAWSPDSRRLAFSCQSDLEAPQGICTLDINTLEVNRLTNKDSESDAIDTRPAWSPDGESIAFTRITDLDNDIFTVSSDGEKIQNVTNTPDRKEWFVFWWNEE